jgi:hypothetical protein
MFGTGKSLGEDWRQPLQRSASLDGSNAAPIKTDLLYRLGNDSYPRRFPDRLAPTRTRVREESLE